MAEVISESQNELVLPVGQLATSKNSSHKTAHNISNSSYIYWAKKLVRINFIINNFPKFTPELSKKYHVGEDDPPEELKRYPKHNIVQAIYIIVLLIEGLKNLYFPIYSVITLKTIEISNESKLGCMVTNCTKLSIDGNISKEFVHLPWFAFCNQKIKYLYTPLISMDALGLIVHTLLSYLAIVTGIFVPLYHIYFEQPSLGPLIFLLSSDPLPKKEYELVRKSLIDVHYSFKNFFKEYKRYLHRSSSETNQIDFFIDSINDCDSEETKIQLLERDLCSMDQATKKYLDDCVPLVRMQQWRKKVAEQFCHVTMFVSMYFLIVIALYIAVLYRVSIERFEQLEAIDKFVKSMSCSIWSSSQSEDQVHSNQIQTVMKDLFTIGFHFDICVAITVVILTVGVNLAFCVISIQELNIEIVETMDRLRLAIECVDHFKLLGLEQNFSSTGFDNANNSFSFEGLRDMQYQNVGSFLGIKYLKPQKNGRGVVKNIILRQLFASGITTNILTDMLIKTYASNRMLSYLAREASDLLNSVLPFLYAVSYGSVLIILYANRLFNDPGVSYTVIAMSSIILTNCVLLAASRIQAKSKTLVMLMWQLVASTTYFQDLRIRHMRSLWIKKVLLMSHDKGLTLIANGIPVTHSSVIQMVLATSTLALLAFGN